MQEDEKQLVSRAASGDRRAFDELTKRYKDKMFSLIYRMTGERETALDLMQDTFFSAFLELPRFRFDSSFGSWLYRIASNKSINFLRRKKLLFFVPLEKTSNSAISYQMEDKVEKSELYNALAEAMAGLPPKQKLAFTLRFHEQLSFNEVAEIMGKKVSTVKTNYQKAIEKLRKQLKDFR